MSDGASGRFVTFEGGEGVGKTTQIAKLAERLRRTEQDVVVTREPGGSPGAEAIRGLLLDMEASAWSPAAEALLFAAARSDHVRRVIQPALARNAWVLCDRFIDSTRAYQGERGGGTLSDADIMSLHKVGSDGLLPDRTILLVVDPEVAAARRASRDGTGGDRFEQRTADFHAAVSRRFIELADEDPDRFRVIPADADPNEVAKRIALALQDILP